MNRVLVIALNTGMRLGKILGLRWEWLELKDNFIYLPQTHTKSKEARRIPINPVVRRILLEKKLESGEVNLSFRERPDTVCLAKSDFHLKRLAWKLA